ncbi:MAG TPA: STAS/SEC14 domain-containing protein [Burkholderiales bacterium]|nr:STAS/SEC14 domain-containing protein [Burkholderiales bacterium]
MIVIEGQNDRLKVHVYGELTLADYREFEKAVTGGLKTAPKVQLLIDLTKMAGFTVDVAWEDIRFTRAHANDFRRIAVVTDSQWLGWIGWLSAAFTDAEVETFETVADAEVWLVA